MIKYIKLFIITAPITISAYENQLPKDWFEKMYDKFCQSKFVADFDAIARQSAAKEDLLDKPNGGLANDSLSEMGKRAQTALGVPIEDQVPIRILNPANIGQFGEFGYTTYDAIFINQEYQGPNAYMVLCILASQLFQLKCAHIRSSYHALRHLRALTFLGATFTGLLIPFLGKYYHHHSRLLTILCLSLVIPIPLSTMTITEAIESKINDIIFNRFCREGCCATQCHQCVQFCKEEFWPNNEIVTKEWVPLYTAMSDMINEFKSKNLICEYHMTKMNSTILLMKEVNW